jgi:hypothetical protein
MNSANPFVRLISACGLSMFLHILVYVIFYLIWIFFVASDLELVINLLLDPQFNYEDYDNNREHALELISVIQAAFVSLAVWSLTLSFAWLLVTAFLRPERPGQVSHLQFVWGVILTIGIVGVLAIFGHHLFEFPFLGGGQTEFLRPELRAPLSVIWILMFLVSFVFFGSVLATPKISRPAVPFAAAILRY